MSKLLCSAVACFVSAAAPAQASTVTVEARFADPRGHRHTDSEEYRVQYDSKYKGINYGLEASTTQRTGSLGTELSVKAGPALPTLFGISPSVYAEVGQALRSQNDFSFWSVGTGLKANVYGPVTVSVGYRHRESFTLHRVNTERLNGGVSIAVDNSNSVGVQYYRTRGTANTDAIGVSVVHKF